MDMFDNTVPTPRGVGTIMNRAFDILKKKEVEQLKKLAFLMVFAMAFALMGGLALAETPHGPFADNTSLCAACHRTHTAVSEYLLSTGTVTSLCISCHDSGKGADTNVMGGKYVTDGTFYPKTTLTAAAALGATSLAIGDTTPYGVGDVLVIDKAGAPETVTVTAVTDPTHLAVSALTAAHALGQTVWNVKAEDHADWGVANGQLMAGGFAMTGQTSKHFDPSSRSLVFGVTFGTGATPGGTVANQTAGKMDCIDCHMPHRSNNYRMLRLKPNGATSDIRVGSKITLGSPQQFTETSAGAMFNVNPPAALTNEGISAWCGSCHNYYFAPFSDSVAMANGSAPRTAAFSASYYAIDGGAAVIPTYMHAVDADLDYVPRNGSSAIGIDMPVNLHTASNANNDKLPVASADNLYDKGDRLTCITCHRAHGSNTTMTGEAALSGHKLGSGAKQVSFDASNSYLLRLDNRGVCETCHNMPQGY